MAVAPAYRPFITYPTGEQVICPVNVATAEDQQKVLNYAGRIVEEKLGALAKAMTPQQKRDASARVEFFRVARG